MSSKYCRVNLELPPRLMQAVKLEAARRNVTIEEMILKYLSTFLPENIDQSLTEWCNNGENQE